MTRTLGDKDGLPDEWDKTVEMLRKTAEAMLGVTLGKRKEDRETWWWNEEGRESKKERSKESMGDENTKKIYKEKKIKAKKTVAMAK